MQSPTCRPIRGRKGVCCRQRTTRTLQCMQQRVLDGSSHDSKLTTLPISSLIRRLTHVAHATKCTPPAHAGTEAGVTSTPERHDGREAEQRNSAKLPPPPASLYGVVHTPQLPCCSAAGASRAARLHALSSILAFGTDLSQQRRQTPGPYFPKEPDCRHGQQWHNFAQTTSLCSPELVARSRPLKLIEQATHHIKRKQTDCTAYSSHKMTCYQLSSIPHRTGTA